MLGGSASRLSDFQLLLDEVLTPGHGVRGVHTVFGYRVDGGPPQVFDQIGYINDDASKVYVRSPAAPATVSRSGSRRSRASSTRSPCGRTAHDGPPT